MMVAFDAHGKPCQTQSDCTAPSTCINAQCVPKSAPTMDPCSNTSECLDSGLCAKVDGACAAKTDAMCKASKRCKTDGECSAKEGICQASDPAICRSVRPSGTSKLKVTYESSPDGFDVEISRCSFETKADCQKNEACTARGACSLARGECIVSAKGCRKSAGCKVSGDCGLFTPNNADATGEAPYCAPTKKSHCTRSTGCKEDGRCHLESSYMGSSCIVNSVKDCVRSALCKSDGLCEFYQGPEGGECVLPEGGR